MKIIKIKKSGFLFIILTIFLGFAAINTGNNLIYLITSTLLGFMGISGFFGKQNIYNLNVKLEFPEEVFANREFPLKIIIKNNRKFLPAFLIKLKISNQYVLFPFINVNDHCTKIIHVKFKFRGINEIKNIQISSTFPYNFFIRFNYIKEDYKKLVYPEPKKYTVFDEILSKDRKSDLTYNSPYLKGFDGELIHLREYNENDPVKLIHWKSSAKTDKLMVKEVSSEIRKSLIIDFDKMIISDLEKKLSAITYLILNAHKKGIKILLKINKETLKERSLILKTLALY